MKLSLCINTSEEKSDNSGADDSETTSNTDYPDTDKIAEVLEHELIKINPEFKDYELAEISLTFVKPDEIRILNREYRNIDEATDVLSFPMFDPEENMPVLMLGDIVICPEEVKRLHPELESREAMMLMTAHSFLHLLGYDHDTEEREKEMWHIQEEIKAKLLEALI